MGYRKTAIQISREMITIYKASGDFARAYDQLDGLSYQLDTESGRIRQMAISLFEAWLEFQTQEEVK